MLLSKLVYPEDLSMAKDLKPQLYTGGSFQMQTFVPGSAFSDVKKGFKGTNYGSPVS